MNNYIVRSSKKPTSPGTQQGEQLQIESTYAALSTPFVSLGTKWITVPPKGKLPSSRETRLVSLETRLVSLETSLVSLERRLVSLETRLVSLEASLVSLECTVSTVQRLRVLVYSSYCVCTHCMKACFNLGDRIEGWVARLARKTVVRLSFMNDVHIFFILKRPSKKFFLQSSK